MELNDRSANPISSRSGYWGEVTDAGVLAHRPMDAPEIVSVLDSSYVVGGSLRPGCRSAPPSLRPSAVDDAPAEYYGGGRVGFAATDEHRYFRPFDERHQHRGDGRGGAQSNDYSTTLSSSFRVKPRRDVDERCSADLLLSMRRTPDRSLPADDVTVPTSTRLHRAWTVTSPQRGTEPINPCLLYTSPSPRDRQKSRMPSSA